MGRFGDSFGRKKVFLLGNILFLIAMLGAGLASTPSYIIFFMAIYGLAGAILLPISQALIVQFFPEEKKGVAIGMWTTVAGIGMAAGPILGGLAMTYLSWRWAFFVNAPLAILGFTITLLFCPESRSEGESPKIDWAGVSLLFLTVGSFVLATVQSTLWNGAIIVGLYIISIISLITLLVVENRVEMPIIREDLFKNRTFLLTAVAGFCLIAFFWGAMFLIPLYIQKKLGLDPLKAGLSLLFLFVPMAIFSPFSGYFYRTFGPKALLFNGFICLAISAMLFLQINGISKFNYIALSILIMGIGFAFIWAPVITSALSCVSKNVAGVASGSFVTVEEIGGSVGVALVGAVVRMTPSFSTGFHHGVWVLLMITIIGIGAVIGMPRRKIQDQ